MRQYVYWPEGEQISDAQSRIVNKTFETNTHASHASIKDTRIWLLSNFTGKVTPQPVASMMVGYEQLWRRWRRAATMIPIWLSTVQYTYSVRNTPSVTSRAVASSELYFLLALCPHRWIELQASSDVTTGLSLSFTVQSASLYGCHLFDVTSCRCYTSLMSLSFWPPRRLYTEIIQKNVTFKIQTFTWQIGGVVVDTHNSPRQTNVD